MKLADLARQSYAAFRSLLALVGIAAVCGAALLPLTRERLAAAFAAEDLWQPATVVAGPIQERLESPAEREQRAVSEFIAKRYRVSEAAVSGYVAAAYRAGAQHSVDPLLLLAVMAVESRYNPVAESVLGAKGLMQVIPKFHLDKLLDHGGEHALLEPEVNIQVGAQILREYQRRLHDTEAALQMYGGAADEPTAQYAARVMAERSRLEALRQRAKRQQSA